MDVRKVTGRVPVLGGLAPFNIPTLLLLFVIIVSVFCATTLMFAQPGLVMVPPQAEDVELLGNGWCEFTYRGNRFLCHRDCGVARIGIVETKEEYGGKGL